MLAASAIISRNAFVESLRQPIFLIVILGVGVLQLLNIWSAAYSMGYTDTSEVSGDNKVALDIGLSTIFVAGMLLAGLTATAVISREIEAKTVLTVVSKPVPRFAVILGKFAGVSGAITIACVCMIAFLLFGVRHGVMSTSADELDIPVLVFSLSAVFLAVIVGAVCNFLYGWSFPQTTIVVLTPALVIAYIAVLLVGPKWEIHPITKDFKPQITIACGAMVMAILVLTSVAVAASTRLGQVMTIAACAGVFLFGLLANHLIGRHAFTNEPVARVLTATPAGAAEADFNKPGDTYDLRLDAPPKRPLRPGSSIYYGDNPNGFRLSVEPFAPFEGDPTDRGGSLGPGRPGALISVAADRESVSIRLVGAVPPKTERPPREDDYLFLGPTRVNRPAAVAWALVPNMHAYWLLDAITQTHKIPASHLGLLAAYSATQIGAMLALATILFQRRDVG